MHVAYCKRNMKKCLKCNEMYHKDEEAQHEEEFHKMVECEDCKIPIEISKIAEHKPNCMKREVICKFCNQQFSYDGFFGHEDICGSRTKPCEFCNKNYRLKDIEDHEIICPTIMAEEQENKKIQEEIKKKEFERQKQEN